MSVFSKLPSKLPIYVLSSVWFMVTAPRSVRRLTHKLVG